MDIPEEKVLSNYALNYDLPHDKTLQAFEKITGIKEGDENFDAAWKAVIEDKSDLVLEEIAEAFGEDLGGGRLASAKISRPSRQAAGV